MLHLLLAICYLFSPSQAVPTVSAGTLPLKVSRVAPGNLLPQFRFMLSQVEGGSSKVNIGGGTVPKSPYIPGDSSPEFMWDHASPDLHAPNLPYLTQDEWGCERRPENVSTILYEDSRLTLHITPQWGARIWSVYDKVLKRDWVFSNPAHQPANIAVRKAWTSGGIEWNWSPGIIGHSVFTEQPAWVGVLNTPRGKVVRAWEYDRLNASVWQVDILLTDGALFVHPKVTNTRTEPIQGYWWTCVAVHVTPASRILTPAEGVEETSYSFQYTPWPFFSMGDPNGTFAGHRGARLTDNSWLEAVTSGDFFMGPTAADEHFIASTDPSGFLAYHGHEDKINGTKFFTWGQSGAGRFMQDFLGGLSGPNPIPDSERVGDYAELQIGPAFTQMQTFDVGREFEWTEYFGAYSGNAATLSGEDYGAALRDVFSWRTSAASGLNDTLIADVSAFLTALSDAPVDEVLSVGSPWGGLELLRRAAPGGGANALPFPKGVLFNATPGGEDEGEALAWLELLGGEGTFSPATLAREPVSYQVSAEWLRVVAESAGAKGSTWLHKLHMAVILAEMGGIEEPKALLQASVAQRPSAVALRCLAVLQNDIAAARALYRDAWRVALAAAERVPLEDPAAPRLVLNLATEIVNFETNLHGDATADAALSDFIASLPLGSFPSLAYVDAVLYARVLLALDAQDWSTAVAILANPGPAGCFPTIAGERTKLMDAWMQAQYLRASAAEGGRALSQWEMREVRRSNPVPRNIGCQYGGGPAEYECCAFLCVCVCVCVLLPLPLLCAARNWPPEFFFSYGGPWTCTLLLLPLGLSTWCQ